MFGNFKFTRTTTPFIFALILVLSGCSGGDGGTAVSPAPQVPEPFQPETPDPEPTDPEPAKGELRAVDPYASAITGVSYPLHIYLPPGYHQSTEKYPVIYATDGQWFARSYADILDASGKAIILVAIEQGPNNRRAEDYLLPGAQDYFQFLVTELMPAIERDYRINSGDRTLVGTSYGGVLVGAALLLDDVSTPAFKRYLSFDGSFFEHPDLTQELQQSRYNASGEMPVTLFLSSAQPGNAMVVTEFEKQLKDRAYQGLNIVRKHYNVHHNNIAAPSLEEALRLFF